MQLRHREKPEPEINVGPFADVAFLLIIFFILTSEFLKPAGKEIMLPSGKTDEQRKSEEYPTVNLGPEGQIRFGEKATEMTLPQLRRKLTTLDLPAQAEEQRIIVVDSDQRVSWQRYYEVTMAIDRAGGVPAFIDRSEE